MFGQLLRKHRRIGDLTLADLAKESGVNATQLGKIESSERLPPELVTVLRLCDVLANKSNEFGVRRSRSLDQTIDSGALDYPNQPGSGRMDRGAPITGRWRCSSNVRARRLTAQQFHDSSWE
jgi:transcriptional regulator with XRE-family HTH domain